MAERRMFAKTIIDSDAFLDMPLSTQSLYFHLSMRADDDGFINNPKKIQRMIGCSDDDLKLLIAKRFLIVFESGVVVIKHWRIHNYIQPDRYHETMYKAEKQQLSLKENKSYTIVDTECIHDGYNLDTQVRLELGKVNNTISKDIVSSSKLQPIIEKWNSLGIQKLVSINSGTKRYAMLKARINEYGVDSIIEAIEKIKQSSFLKGQNNKNWIVTFDWFVKPNNFIKVLEGNYTDKEGVSHGHNTSSSGEGKKWDYTIPECELTDEDRKWAEENML